MWFQKPVFKFRLIRLHSYNVLYVLVSGSTELWDHQGGVIVRVLSTNAVYRGLGSRSKQTEYYQFNICSFSA